MTWLLEQPWLVGIGGLVLVAMLVGGWIQTGRRSLLGVAAGVLLLTVALLVVERLVVTERERVKQTLLLIAADVESNDIERVVRHVSSTTPEVRAAAASEMPRYRFDEVRITRIHEIRVNMDHIPPRADVQFNVVVVGGDRGGLISGQRYPRYVELMMFKEDDAWKVAGYRHDDPTYAIRRRD